MHNIWAGKWVVDVVVGNRSNRFKEGGSWVWRVPLDHERGTVPSAPKTNDVSDIAVAVEIRCQRTERAMAKWWHDTHAKLTLAYRARLAGPLPPITSPLYLPIAQEIAARLDRPGDELAQGDPWVVRIPTPLVRLRPDDSLPQWTQDGNGIWVEA